jgi:hypothetical protein
LDRYTAIVAMTALISGTILLSVLAQAFVQLRAGRAAKKAPDVSFSRIEDRLSRIEQAIDAMSVEVERISEGQRFTTKLLSDRVVERT